jgi:hypothetical protein
MKTILLAGIATILLTTSSALDSYDLVLAAWPRRPALPFAEVDTRTNEKKIAIAMSAGPPEIAKGARIIDVDSTGHTEVLREGVNGFTCVPGNGDTHPPMCADQPSMQWFNDFSAHRLSPTNVVPGITYMLAGAMQRSDSDPYDERSPLIKIGPHWMIMWPFDPATTGLPSSHRNTGAYIVWPETPYAHLRIIGSPSGA